MTLRGLFIRTSVLSHEHRAVERMRIASNQTHCNTSTKSLRSTTRKQSGKSALVRFESALANIGMQPGAGAAGVFSSCLPRLAGAVAGTCMVVKDRPARPSDVHGHGPGWRVDKLIRRGRLRAAQQAHGIGAGLLPLRVGADTGILQQTTCFGQK